VIIIINGAQKEGKDMVKIIYLLLLGVLLSGGGLERRAVAGEKDSMVPTPLTKKVDDYYVSIGIFSIADLEERFARAYKFLVKHHGKPSKTDSHHLAVSIWKQEEGKTVYVSDFEVSAEVRSPILRAVRKKLTKYPHQHGDNFGGWFDMSDKGLYHIAVIIKKDGKTRRVDFDYLMQ
jgi:hypothetical protein